MSNSRMPGVFQTALNAVVDQAVGALRDQGFQQDADRYAAEWSAHYSSALTSLSSMAIGDHSPLSDWLKDLYTTLLDKLGATICHDLHLDDIFTLNYGIPVAIHPSGYLGDSWDSPEYSSHFVPAAGAATYWVTKSACSAAVPGLAGLFCGTAGSIVRDVVESVIAPPLADYIYGQAHGSDGQKPEYDFDSLTQDARK
jgi:hypothetical protein